MGKFDESLEDDYDESMDPFSPQNAPKVAVVIQMRIYDALMAILNDIDHEAATALANLHAEGKILGALPWLNLSDDEESGKP